MWYVFRCSSVHQCFGAIPRPRSWFSTQFSAEKLFFLLYFFIFYFVFFTVVPRHLLYNSNANIDRFVFFWKNKYSFINNFDWIEGRKYIESWNEKWVLSQVVIFKKLSLWISNFEFWKMWEKKGKRKETQKIQMTVFEVSKRRKWILIRVNWCIENRDSNDNSK